MPTQTLDPTLQEFLRGRYIATLGTEKTYQELALCMNGLSDIHRVASVVLLNLEAQESLDGFKGLFVRGQDGVAGADAGAVVFLS
jgi:hypothetical protein